MAHKDKSNVLVKGDIVNDTYEIRSLIGQGAFGEVYKVKHKYLGVQVLKVFRESYVATTDIETVTNEAKLLSKLTHPNIVRVFETNSFVKDGKTFFFMTTGFVSGEPLSHLLKRKISLPLPVSLSIQSDFMTGLKIAHEQSSPIIHRDISPDNILLSYSSQRPEAMLSDFGLAQSFDQVSSIPNAGGKYAYMAPECFWGTSLLSSDVFSAGVVLYRMLTGIMPWEYDFEGTGNDPDDIMTMIIVARKTAPRNPSFYCDGCDERLNEVVLKSLAISIEGRYKNAAEFLEALNECQQSRSKTEPTLEDRSRDVEIGKHYRGSPIGKGFDQIAGINKVKDILFQDVILPLREKELYEQYKISIPNGMLLYGPPGCGKTFIAEKFAEEAQLPFFQVKPSDLASTYIHGTQEKIGQLFNKAKEQAPAIIFIDELDAVVPARTANRDHSYTSEVNEFLVQLTECNRNGIFVVGATNRPENIDPAILRTGRMDKVIYIGPPDFEARVEMFKLYLDGRPCDVNINYDHLADITRHYVSSDIKFIINEAARVALKERSKIKQEHLEKVIDENLPSISEKELLRYQSFGKSRSFQ